MRFLIRFISAVLILALLNFMNACQTSKRNVFPEKQILTEPDEIKDYLFKCENVTVLTHDSQIYYLGAKKYLVLRDTLQGIGHGINDYKLQDSLSVKIALNDIAQIEIDKSHSDTEINYGALMIIAAAGSAILLYFLFIKPIKEIDDKI
jgi:hypothetical protein